MEFELQIDATVQTAKYIRNVARVLPECQSRREKAKQIFVYKELQVIEIEGDETSLAFVKGKHTISMLRFGAACSCPDFQRNNEKPIFPEYAHKQKHVPCKHLIAAAAMIIERHNFILEENRKDWEAECRAEGACLRYLENRGAMETYNEEQYGRI